MVLEFLVYLLLQRVLTVLKDLMDQMVLELQNLLQRLL
jgi:hypothetical protein